jgi:hypothetical protein
LDLSLDINDAQAVYLESGNWENLLALLDQGMTVESGDTGAASDTPATSLEPVANYDAGAIVDSIYIGGNALQNAQSLLNLVVQGGDVGVGINITLVMNPVASEFSVHQFNFNFSNFLGYDTGH